MKILSKEQLNKLIIQAFSGVTYPGDDHLVDSEFYDLERLQIKEFFRGKKWDSITLQGLDLDYVGDPSACLNFMTGEARRYFLPTYMLITINEFEEADVIVDSTVYILMPKSIEGKDFDRFFEWTEQFSALQKNAIKNFLLYLKKNHTQDDVWDEPGIALARYWDK